MNANHVILIPNHVNLNANHVNLNADHVNFNATTPQKGPRVEKKKFEKGHVKHKLNQVSFTTSSEREKPPRAQRSSKMLADGQAYKRKASH